jgi:hypothetical protein
VTVRQCTLVLDTVYTEDCNRIVVCTYCVHEQARSAGWLFPIPPATDPLDMWRLFDFTAVSM